MLYSTKSIGAFALGLAALPAQGYQIPSNVQAFYDAHKSGACSNPVSKGFTDGQTSARNFVYCGDADNVIFIKGPGGEYSDMDIDCDGANHSAGLCANDPSGQSVTAFDSTLQSYGVGLNHLDAHIHPYVVLGGSGFNLQAQGVKPLSVVAVVCNGRLEYGIWGDVAGVTTGEAALSMGQLCFDNTVTANSGHSSHDVLYIAFEGGSAVPGAKGANWGAKTKEQFEASIKSLGEQLVAGL